MKFIVYHSLQFDIEFNRLPSDDEFSVEESANIETLRQRFPKRICAFEIKGETRIGTTSKHAARIIPPNTDKEMVVEWLEL